MTGLSANACGEDRIEHFSNRGAGTDAPDSPPARICDDATLLAGPTMAPGGAVVVEAGDNSAIDFSADNAVYWFAPGVHTLGDSGDVHIAPGNHSTFTGAPGAILDGQGRTRYAFAGMSNDVTIAHLTFRNFNASDDEGVLNHDSSDDWTFESCIIRDNGGAGIMLGSNNVVRDCCIKDNGQFGLHAYKCSYRGGAYPRDCANLGEGTGTNIKNLIIEHNEIAGSDNDDEASRDPTCQCSGGITFWDVDGAVIRNNWIHDNLVAGMMADANSRNVLVEGNYIEENGAHAIRYTTSYNASVVRNTFKRNCLRSGPRTTGFPDAAVYIDESGGDASLGGAYTTLHIADNRFEDNWNAVTLWEDSEHFCGYPENTGAGYCTLHFSNGYDASPCSQATIASNSLACRWKTQNVIVERNLFSLNKENVGCSGNRCGHNAIIANFGSVPVWSPYLGDVIQRAIAFEQNNVFRDNSYVGDWTFEPLEPGRDVDWVTWRGAPYNQDSGSRSTH